jgi:hypothetical protein
VIGRSHPQPMKVQDGANSWIAVTVLQHDVRFKGSDAHLVFGTLEVGEDLHAKLVDRYAHTPRRLSIQAMKAARGRRIS